MNNTEKKQNLINIEERKKLLDDYKKEVNTKNCKLEKMFSNIDYMKWLESII